MRIPALIAAFLLLAGCSQPAPNEEPALPSPDPEPPVSILNETWVATGCRNNAVAMTQDQTEASQGVPGDYQVAGDVVATLELHVSACESLTIGNQSVLQPFSFAALFQILRPVSDNPDDLDVFVREVVVPDAGVAQTLVDFGFPAEIGAVGWSGSSPSYQISVESANIAYFVDAGGADGPAPLDDSQTTYWRGGVEGRLFWASLSERFSSAVAITDVGLVQATDGYVADVYGGLPTPATAYQTTSTIVFAFGEKVSR